MSILERTPKSDRLWNKKQSRNVITEIAYGSDTFIVKRDPVSKNLYSVARRGSSKVVPPELQVNFKTATEAVDAVNAYIEAHS